MNKAKNGRVKSSMSLEVGRIPVGQCTFQGFNESGGVASGPLRMVGMEEGRETGKPLLAGEMSLGGQLHGMDLKAAANMEAELCQAVRPVFTDPQVMDRGPLKQHNS